MFRHGAIAGTTAVLVALLFVPVWDSGSKFGWLPLWQVYWMLGFLIGQGMAGGMVIVGLILAAVHLGLSASAGALIAWGTAGLLRAISSGRTRAASSAPR